MKLDKKSIFRQESLERVESPEQLDEYIRVSRPSAWIVLAALLLLAISVIVWSVTGTLPQTMTVKGVTATSGRALCYVDPSLVQKDLTGCKVQVTLPDNTKATGTIEAVSQMPYSSEEISESLQNDWMVKNLISSQYAYQIEVLMDQDVQEDLIVDAAIITDEVKPIKYILN